MDDELELSEIEAAVGQAPRTESLTLWKYSRRKPPPYADDSEAIKTIYTNYEKVFKQGVVCWGALIHANSTLYEEGTEDSRGQIVYCETPIQLEELLAIANRLGELKNSYREDQQERAIVDMLTSERAEALDWRLPNSLSAGKPVYTTLLEIRRDNIPRGRLGLAYIPILAEPESKIAAIIPCEYWPDTLQNRWISGVDQIQMQLRQIDPVILTPSAADAIYAISHEQGMSRFFIHMSLFIHGDQARYDFDLKRGDPNPREYFARTQFGLCIAVPKDKVALLRGCVVDFREHERGVGFVFDHPQMT